MRNYCKGSSLGYFTSENELLHDWLSNYVQIHVQKINLRKFYTDSTSLQIITCS
ncbi:hypothetical protein XBFM1_2200011 [Xenorhabdus bovienii str. feltiae Moldova]|uniref:Uncharacterized protein n=1 Tax=Xenorhabdus bovienii str. feltiae Moldova TaxID=1398200 RepID=A0A077NV94_XENBV|nr:hypothetical protein XBFM1_2200011 [Xenorhabdus bovienii str. feltiae Moldova]